MQFNHLHFFVDDLASWRDRFVEEWGATLLKKASSGSLSPALETDQVVNLGQVPIILSAPDRRGDLVDRYLDHHPPGIGDVAFRVNGSLRHWLTRLLAHGGTVLNEIQSAPSHLQWCRVQGWAKLSHTLIQSPGPGLWLPGWGKITAESGLHSTPAIEAVDHAVINVPAGQLADAVDWYVQRFGFCPRQQFTIDTPNSGLRSQVLAHPQGSAQLPINEPVTPNSQVQEFLDWNRGAGVQHVALRTRNILTTVRNLKARGIEFLHVPESYYRALMTRPGYSLATTRLEAIARLGILVDWNLNTPQAPLLQTFTQPLLDIPTLFFEIIQRQTPGAENATLYAEGFGEHNFQALFEAIEREQGKRGSLKPV